MPSEVQYQASIYETTIENAELETALEDLQKARDRAKSARTKVREADDKVRPLIDELELGDDAPVRVGRFVITRKRVAPREVAFTTDSSVRLYIRPIPELA